MVLQVLLGIVLVVLGAEAVLRGASTLKQRYKIPAFVIGLILVGFGTSLPETAIGIGATLMRFEGLALGLLLGSSIVNLALILGLSAIVKPLEPSRRAIGRDSLVTTLAALYLLASAVIVPTGWAWPVFGLLMFTAYVVMTVVKERALAGTGVMAQKANYVRAGPAKTLFGALLVLGGFAAIIFGSAQLIEGSVGYAADMGVQEAIIGLALVAIITSIPEAVISLHSAFKGQCDVAIGNLLGSNIFNLLVVLPVCMLLMPAGESLFAGGWAMYALAALLVSLIACIFIMSDRVVSRAEGAILVIIYGCFLIAALQ